MKQRRVAFYLRVSTSDQTTANQRRELDEVAVRAGWNVGAVYEDAGVSGSKGRQHRPGYDALLKAVTRREVDMVAAWSVDRIGRSMPELVAFLAELHARGADLYLHQQALDTSTPGGRAMFQMMGVFAEFERAMIQERVKAGLARARADGKRLGRPTVGDELERQVRALRSSGMGILRVAQTLSIGTSTVQRIVATMQREGSPSHSSCRRPPCAECGALRRRVVHPFRVAWMWRPISRVPPYREPANDR
ncbi:recombinase family protein [Ancylobacter amanitiformis]|uniref:DNA invertase Pin-like site-specific DNA recombinase n=1 Tax=Ancylobacter amanitiformis TaxID=217069 RepID=A0ABU0LXM9_9HYPH|nr:recombinase family protein [Ancylobacter amanitiformis]MDQ0513476.1 DNA invertase Pin-like site-specific DNA recombinase [Ancylobacter amanitiformis]